MASAMEAEIAAMFMNARLLAEFRQTLEDMGHPQPASIIRTDSKTGCGVLNGTLRQHKSKVADMNLNWLKDGCQRSQFQIEWAPGVTNLADYPTKHHTGSHHKKVRPIQTFIRGESPLTLQGCDRILAGGRRDFQVEHSHGPIPVLLKD